MMYRHQAKIRLTLDTIQTMKPFSSMLYVSMVLSSCRIFPAGVGQRQRGDARRGTLAQAPYRPAFRINRGRE